MYDTMKRVHEHYEEALEYFPKDRIVACILQGSQNYSLEVPGSDVDTKLIVTPTFKDIAMNRKPVSTTHVRENDEHIDFKDIRLYIETFRRQNLNFLEILFSPYKIVNPMYETQWNRLVEAREDITHYNLFRAVKSMKGIAMEKFHALKHPYPSKLEVLAKYSYDPKQLHHLLRVEDYLVRYIAGESYENCLKPTNTEYLKEVKLGKFSLQEAEKEAERSINRITQLSDEYCISIPNEGNPKVDELLNDVQYKIMKIAIKEEIVR